MRFGSLRRSRLDLGRTHAVTVSECVNCRRLDLEVGSASCSAVTHSIGSKIVKLPSLSMRANALRASEQNRRMAISLNAETNDDRARLTSTKWMLNGKHLAHTIMKPIYYCGRRDSGYRN